MEDAYPLSLSGQGAAMLLLMTVPPLLLQAAHYVASVASNHSRDLMALEVFSGAGCVARAFRAMGDRASTYDCADGADEDICTTAGFLNLLKKTLRLRPGGLFYGGHPCANHVWISKSIHARDKENPWGNLEQPSVRCTNVITARFCMLLFVATVRHVYSAIEQPMSSSLRYIPYFQYIRALLAAVKSAGAGWDHCSFWMGLYGAATLKPSYLMGCGRWLGIKNKISKEKKKTFQSSLVRRRRRSDGTEAVTGLPAELKRSQEYPPGFAKAIARIHREQFLEDPSGFPGPRLDLYEVTAAAAQVDRPGDWTEADLDDLRCYLLAEAANGAWKPLEGLPL